MTARGNIVVAAAFALISALGACASGTDAQAQRNTQLQVQRLTDVYEIQNLMSRYEYYHVAGMHEQSVALFAQHAAGVRLEIADFGVYDGIDSVRRFYIGANQFAEGDRVGHLHLHTLTTPVIEVAGDGQTAQGVWVSPGVETGPARGEMRAMWAWVKYGVDFIKEDGEWRFWHFHVYRVLMAEPGQSWADGAPRPPPVLPEAIRPDRPNTYSWRYGPNAVTENVPAPPTPYETWDDSRAYVQ